MNRYGEDFKGLEGLPFADLYLNNKAGILLIRYHEKTDINLEKAKLVVAKVEPILQNNITLGITDARSPGLYINREARNLYKDNPSMRANKAHAVLVNNISTRVLANFFITVDKPVSPTKIFNHIEPALEWLSQF